MLTMEKSYDGDLLGSFPGNVWARTKHAKKACVDFWGNSKIIEVVPGNYPWPMKAQGATNDIKANLQLWATLVDRRALGNHLARQRYWDGSLIKRTYKSVG